MSTYLLYLLPCTFQYLKLYKEEVIVKYLLKMSDLGYPIRMKFIPSLAYSVTHYRPTTERPLKAPRYNWAKALEKRYPILLARRVKALDSLGYWYLAPLDNLSTLTESVIDNVILEFVSSCAIGVPLAGGAKTQRSFLFYSP
jgi:hypothetical protein